MKSCYRCGDSAKDYPVFRLVTRTTDNGTRQILVCEPCAEILDRKDEQKLLSALRPRNERSGNPRRLFRRGIDKSSSGFFERGE